MMGALARNILTDSRAAFGPLFHDIDQAVASGEDVEIEISDEFEGAT